MRYKLSLSERPSGKRGFTLLASGVCIVALFGAAGLAVDIGRMYITKNEAQSYADAAAVAAALRLDGTAAGLSSADAAVTASPNKWGFSTTPFGAATTASNAATVTEYSADGLNGWQSSGAATPAIARYARVTATVANLPLYLLPVLGAATNSSIGVTTTVRASAVAGQILEPPTVFPYAPIAHAVNCNSWYSSLPPLTLPTLLSTGQPCDSTGNFGFQIGQLYDLRWPQNPDLVGAIPCDGDAAQSWINMLAGGPPQVGPVVFSASGISQQIQDSVRPYNPPLAVGQTLGYLANGAKNSLVTDFQARAQLDDQTNVLYQAGLTNIHDNTTYHSYETGPNYNGQRKITVVVRTGFSDTSAVALVPTTWQSLSVGFAEFLLLPSAGYASQGGGGNPWCGTYIGNSVLYGAKGTGVGTGGLGVAYVRLTQ